MTAYTPNLPALIPSILSSSKDALPGPGSEPGAGDRPRAPQESDAAASTPPGCCPQCAAALPGAEPVPTSAEGRLFTRARLVLFLENLSVTGSVRSAAAAAQVSHQTAYRARRATAAFRTAWDAALVVARVSVADTVGCRAIDGITEPVFYHGEEVGSRTRFSDRLLLAHLARLDRLVENASANAFAEDFDAGLAAFERGEDFAPATPSPGGGGKGDFLSPGPCNTRSMSYTPDEEVEDALDDEEDLDDYDVEMAELEAEALRIEADMAAQRPADAPLLTGVGPDGVDRDPDGLNAEAQREAFVRGVPRWWRVVGPWPWAPSGEPLGPWLYYKGAAASSEPRPRPNVGHSQRSDER